MIYEDFESVLVSENNGKQNPKESCTNKYEKHIASSYNYKLACVDEKFSKPSKTYLLKNVSSALLVEWSKKVNIAVK